MRLESLLATKLIFVTGKGGVGKSTISTALAIALAEHGRRTLLVETDTYSAASELLGVRSSDHAAVEARPRLDLINLRAEEAFVETVKRFLPSERLVRALLNNRVARVFFKAAPSVNEFVLLDRIFSYGEGDRYDHVVVDLPASGHAVTFLNVPATLHNMLKVGPVAELARAMADRLSDPDDTAILAVCLPEEMPVNETIELADKLRAALKRGLSAVVANMAHYEPMSPELRQDFDQLRATVERDGAIDEPLEQLVFGNELVLDWFERDHKYIALLRERLPNTLAIIEIPMFYESDARHVIDHATAELLADAPAAQSAP